VFEDAVFVEVARR